MSIIGKAAKILGKNKKPKEPEKQQVIIENAEVFMYPDNLRNKEDKAPAAKDTSKATKPDAKAKVSKEAKLESKPIIKPYIVGSEDELEAAATGKSGTFKEAHKPSGIQTKGNESWDKERMREMLFNTEPEKLPMITVTRQGEFNSLVRATSFNDVAVLGEKRDLRTQSFISIYIRNRDIRAPSAFPKEGDSRNEIMKQLEYMIQEEQGNRESMNLGGGR